MSLVLSEGGEIEGSQVRADIVLDRFLGNTLDLCRSRRADRSRAGSRRRTLGGWRAFHIRATRTRAGRALTTLLLTGTVVDDDRLGFRDTALQDVLAEVRGGRALCLQHILGHIGASRAGRNRALQDILAQVRFTTRRAGRSRCRPASTRAVFSTCLASRNTR